MLTFVWLNQFFAYKTQVHRLWLNVLCNIWNDKNLIVYNLLINFLNLIKESKAAA